MDSSSPRSLQWFISTSAQALHSTWTSLGKESPITTLSQTICRASSYRSISLWKRTTTWRTGIAPMKVIKFYRSLSKTALRCKRINQWTKLSTDNMQAAWYRLHPQTLMLCIASAPRRINPSPGLLRSISSSTKISTDQEAWRKPDHKLLSGSIESSTVSKDHWLSKSLHRSNTSPHLRPLSSVESFSE